MKPPVKFILINYPQFKAILQLEVVVVLDTLEIQYNLYMLTFITDSIVSSLQANPSNISLFETLSKELKFRSSFNLIEAEPFVLSMKKILSSYDPTSVEYIEIIFPKKKMKLYLNYLQIYSISTFMESFVNNYEVVKLYLSQEREEIKPNIFSQPTQQKTDKIELNDEQIDNNQEEQIEEHNLDLTVLINDSLKLAPNNICSYYINKYVLSSMNYIQRSEPLEITDNNITKLKISPLINFNKHIISYAHSKDLYSIIDSFNFIKDEYLSKLKLLNQNLNYLISYYNNCEDKSRAKEIICLPLKIIHFLMFLYTMKLSNVNSINKLTINNIDTLVNQALNFIMSRYFNKQNNIIFESLHSSDDDKYKILEDELNQILVKEKQMLQIDRDSFINNTYKKLSQPKEILSKKVTLKLHSPISLNIEQFINGNHQINTLLSYTHITPNEKQFSDRKIISKEYYDLLYISIIPKISISTVDLSPINPLITKYYDIILNTIFKELNSKQLEEPVSTLYILDYFINPFIQNTSTVYTDLFLLFRLIVPYLYDNFNIKNYIDYFH